MLQAYIAGKVNKHEDVVLRLGLVLKSYGFTIGYDWSKYVVEKPFEDHWKEAASAAYHMFDAVRACDLFILIFDDDLLGGHIETGFAIASAYEEGPRKTIIIMGEKSDRSIFYFLPCVHRVKTEEELMIKLESLYKTRH
jgi:hypothetical protein